MCLVIMVDEVGEEGREEGRGNGRVRIRKKGMVRIGTKKEKN